MSSARRVPSIRDVTHDAGQPDAGDFGATPTAAAATTPAVMHPPDPAPVPFSAPFTGPADAASTSGPDGAATFIQHRAPTERPGFSGAAEHAAAQHGPDERRAALHHSRPPCDQGDGGGLGRGAVASQRRRATPPPAPLPLHLPREHGAGRRPSQLGPPSRAHSPSRSPTARGTCAVGSTPHTASPVEDAPRGPPSGCGASSEMPTPTGDDATDAGRGAADATDAGAHSGGARRSRAAADDQRARARAGPGPAARAPHAWAPQSDARVGGGPVGGITLVVDASPTEVVAGFSDTPSPPPPAESTRRAL